jgi:hypothetical protein
VTRRTSYTPIDLVFDDKLLIPEYERSFKEPKSTAAETIEKLRIESGENESLRCQANFESY